MDTGSNRLLVAVNVESIAEVKVLTSGYQAEYGRSSGLQITAVTKSGTNRFQRIVYDVERNSDWNANSKENKLNGDPKTITKQRDWGYSIGGPVGRPGGNNKLFFFYAQEFQPRTGGNNVVRHRMPTALERAGDFSQTTDNNGNLYSLIRDTSTGLPCTTTDTSGCFRMAACSGGSRRTVCTRPGLNILKMFPMPNVTAAPGWRTTSRSRDRPRACWRISPRCVSTTSRRRSCGRASSTPAGRSGNRRSTARSRGSTTTRDAESGRQHDGGHGQLQPEPDDVSRGHVRAQRERAGRMRADRRRRELLHGRSADESRFEPRSTPGSGTCRSCFRTRTILNPDYYAYDVLNDVKPPIWDGTRIQMPPGFTWGGRVSNNNRIGRRTSRSQGFST